LSPDAGSQVFFLIYPESRIRDPVSLHINPPIRAGASGEHSSMTEGTLENIQVVGLGQACLDCLGRVPSYPEEDGKVELIDIQYQCGGPASTAMVTLSRLGIRTTFLGSISNDPNGKEILKGLKDENIETSCLKITPGYTSQFAFIAITEKTGKRTIFWEGGSVPKLRSSDVNLTPFSQAKILHLDDVLIDASMEAVRQARSLGLKVVMDAGTMRQGARELASLADILIASESFAESLSEPHASPESALDSLKQLGPKEVVITLGSKGSLGWDGSKVTSQKAFPVEVKDTTGAGDVYHGAYIYGLLQEWDMAVCMHFASAVSAIKCTEIGARKGIPRREEVTQFMKDFPNL
jgi:ribokinase